MYLLPSRPTLAPAFAFLIGLSSLSARAQPFPDAPPPPPPPSAAVAPPLTDPDDAAKNAVPTELARLGCRVESLVELTHVYYAACQGAGVWIVLGDAQGTLRVSERHTTSAPIRSLYLRGNAVWVETSDDVAQPVSRLPLIPQAPPPAAGAAPRVDKTGKVVEVSTDQLTITLGKQDGLQVGDHVDVFVAPTGADPEFSEPSERVLVGRVTAVSDARARVTIGLCEDAREGMSVRYTYDPLTASNNSPPRTPGILVLEGALRPFMPLKPVSFGVLGDVALTYLAPIPMYLRLELRPVGARIGGDTDGVFAGFASVGYDHSYFGLGIGVGTIYHSIARTVGSNLEDVIDSKMALGTLLNVRLGSRDGVNVALTTTFALRGREWQFGFVDLTGQAPLGSRNWLTGGIGGGNNTGYVYFEIGFRRLIAGNGNAGSLFIRPSVGIAGIEKRRPGSDSSSVGVGPLVGLHLEGRLAP